MTASMVIKTYKDTEQHWRLFFGALEQLCLNPSAYYTWLHILIKKLSLTAQWLKFSNKDSFSKCEQIRKKLWIWSHLLKKSLLENFNFCTVVVSIRSVRSETFSYKNLSIVTSMNANISLFLDMRDEADLGLLQHPRWSAL